MDFFAPHLRRTADCMEHHARLKNDKEKQETAELARHSGEVLEAISVAAGSVGHIFRGVQMQGGQPLSMKPVDVKPHFKEIVNLGKRTTSAAGAAQKKPE